MLPSFSGLQQFISFGPILCLGYPEHFLHLFRTSPCLSIMTSQMSSCPLLPCVFVKNFGPALFPGIFMYLLPLPHLIHRYLSAFARHSVRFSTFSLFFSTKTNYSFGLGLSSSQSFHCCTRQRQLAAYRIAAYTSSLPCCIVSALASAIYPSSSIASSFANSSPFSLPSATNFSNFFFLHMFHFHQDASLCQTI